MSAGKLEVWRFPKEPIYRCEASRTLREGAEEFVRFYWPLARRVRDFGTHVRGHATFSVENGTRSYIAWFEDGRILVGILAGRNPGEVQS